MASKRDQPLPPAAPPTVDGVMNSAIIENRNLFEKMEVDLNGLIRESNPGSHSSDRSVSPQTAFEPTADCHSARDFSVKTARSPANQFSRSSSLITARSSGSTSASSFDDVSTAMSPHPQRNRSPSSAGPGRFGKARGRSTTVKNNTNSSRSVRTAKAHSPNEITSRIKGMIRTSDYGLMTAKDAGMSRKSDFNLNTAKEENKSSSDRSQKEAKGNGQPSAQDAWSSVQPGPNPQIRPARSISTRSESTSPYPMRTADESTPRVDVCRSLGMTPTTVTPTNTAISPGGLSARTALAISSPTKTATDFNTAVSHMANTKTPLKSNVSTASPSTKTSNSSKSVKSLFGAASVKTARSDTMSNEASTRTARSTTDRSNRSGRSVSFGSSRLNTCPSRSRSRSMNTARSPAPSTMKSAGSSSNLGTAITPGGASARTARSISSTRTARNTSEVDLDTAIQDASARTARSGPLTPNKTAGMNTAISPAGLSARTARSISSTGTAKASTEEESVRTAHSPSVMARSKTASDESELSVRTCLSGPRTPLNTARSTSQLGTAVTPGGLSARTARSISSTRTAKLNTTLGTGNQWSEHTARSRTPVSNAKSSNLNTAITPGGLTARTARSISSTRTAKAASEPRNMRTARSPSVNARSKSSMSEESERSTRTANSGPRTPLNTARTTSQLGTALTPGGLSARTARSISSTRTAKPNTTLGTENQWSEHNARSTTPVSNAKSSHLNTAITPGGLSARTARSFSPGTAITPGGLSARTALPISETKNGRDRSTTPKSSQFVTAQSYTPHIDASNISTACEPQENKRSLFGQSRAANPYMVIGDSTSAQISSPKGAQSASSKTIAAVSPANLSSASFAGRSERSMRTARSKGSDASTKSSRSLRTAVSSGRSGKDAPHNTPAKDNKKTMGNSARTPVSNSSDKSNKSARSLSGRRATFKKSHDVVPAEQSLKRDLTGSRQDVASKPANDIRNASYRHPAVPTTPMQRGLSPAPASSERVSRVSRSPSPATAILRSATRVPSDRFKSPDATTARDIFESPFSSRAVSNTSMIEGNHAGSDSVVINIRIPDGVRRIDLNIVRENGTLVHQATARMDNTQITVNGQRVLSDLPSRLTMEPSAFL